MHLFEIASILDAELRGSPDIKITHASSLKDATEGSICFFDDVRLISDLKACKASAIITKEFIDGLDTAQLKVKNPRLSFAKVLKALYPIRHAFKGISQNAYVSSSADVSPEATVYPFAFVLDGVKIGSGTVIMPFVFVGEGSSIGSNCLIYPNVTIREHTVIGNNVIIHSGAVIGSDGFGYVQAEGRHVKIPQVGNVIIEDDVEVGANTTIDRATTGCTRISKGTKIDNLVQVAHNVTLGSHCIIVSQVGIAGSAELGDYVIIGGQGAVADHTKLSSGVIGSARVAFTGEVSKGTYGGAPHMPHKQFLRSAILQTKLPELHTKLINIEERLKKLESKQGDTDGN